MGEENGMVADHRVHVGGRMDTTDQADRKHTLYHFWGGGELLYIGITCNVATRMRTHKQRDWWLDVDTITLEHYDTREDVRAAEIRAVYNEQPSHNIRLKGERGAWQAMRKLADASPQRVGVGRQT